MSSFKDLNLDNWIIKNIENIKYTKPTPIQLESIPAILKGENFVGIAQTGSGKTASFCLPILSEIAKDPSSVCALIIEPTRELALQVVEQIKIFSAGIYIRIAMIIGGNEITGQLSEMANLPHIVVATPGRLSYFIKDSPDQFSILENLKYLIIDEFDQLVNDTILPDLNAIIKSLPISRQTLFYSATINKNIHNDEFFSQFYTGSKPKFVDLAENSQQRTVTSVSQKFILTPENIKEVYLIHALQKLFYKKYTIIFVSSCKKCHFISEILKLWSIKNSCLHSKMPQKQRFETIEKFKGKVNKVLIATDVASRGLDIPEVDLVLNFDIPHNPDDYIHRIGRTARAGKYGTALSFVTQFDVELILAIEKQMGDVKLEEIEVQDEEILENLSLVSKSIKLVQMKMFENKMDDKLVKKKTEKKSKIVKK